MFKSLFTLFIILGTLCAGATVVETSPGNLSNDLDKLTLDASLIVKGDADARDFEALRNLPESVETIDLSELKINSLSSDTPVFANFSFFEENFIPPFAFFFSKAKQIILPEGITGICEGAFAHSAISSITVPDSVLTIGDYAFFNAINLASVLLPNSLTSIGMGAFEKCSSLANVNLQTTKVMVLSNRAFALCPALKNITLPSSLVKLGDEVFLNSTLENLNADMAWEYGNFLFSNSQSLKSVNLNEGATYGIGLFFNCSQLETLNGIPVDVPDLFAANCPGLVIEDFVKKAQELGQFSFVANSVSKIILSPELNSIDAFAFANLPNLSEVSALGLYSNVPITDPDAFAGVDLANVKLTVDANSSKAWREHPVWQQFDIVSSVDSAVDEIKAENNIDIRLADGRIIVVAQTPITDVSVYSIAGLKLTSVAPSDYSVSINISELSSAGNILIVNASTGTSSKSVKIIL